MTQSIRILVILTSLLYSEEYNVPGAWKEKKLGTKSVGGEEKKKRSSVGLYVRIKGEGDTKFLPCSKRQVGSFIKIGATKKS